MIPSFQALELRSGLAAAWRWWIDELRQCLPAVLRERWRARQPRLGLRVDGEVPALYDVSAAPRLLAEAEGMAGLPALLGHREAGELGRRGVVLCLGEASCLLRELTVPASAAASLERILALDVARLTPFKLEDIAFAWRATRQADGKAAVTQAIVKRAEVGRWIAAVKAQGFAVRGIAVGSAWREFDLLRQFDGPPSRMTRGMARARQGLMLATAACVALAPIILLHKQGEARVALETQIERSREAAVAAGKQFKEIEASTETIARLGRGKAASPIVAAVIDEVTRILPDDAWLTSFGLERKEVSLAGSARSAVSLLGMLEASEMFEGARFTAPVSIDREDGSERFSIALKLAERAP